MPIGCKAHNPNEKNRTQDIEIDEIVDFSSMYLCDPVADGLVESGFYSPSPIQLAAIPLGRCGLDLVVQAKNGTGKTLVFTIIALEMISVQTKCTQVLVLAPTREIAVQIADVIKHVGCKMENLKVHSFIGGLSLQDDKQNLKHCHIAVGTPGRVLQLLELNLLNLSNMRLFVLDEADQLLSGQFKDSVKSIMRKVATNKQIVALSATYSEESQNFIKSLMRCPHEVKLGHNSPALLGVNQAAVILPQKQQMHLAYQSKFEKLTKLLKTIKFNQCLVFSNSQLRAESICNKLKSNGWPACFLTGAQQQTDRLKAFNDFCSYKCRVLVSTDLAARGLDSEHVNLVINLDVPHNQATYLHRVGRAGRFGAFGCAISIVCTQQEIQSLKAVAMLSNVQIGIMPRNTVPDITLGKFEFHDHLAKLSDEQLESWVAKQHSWGCTKKANKVESEVKPVSNTVPSITTEAVSNKETIIHSQNLLQSFSYLKLSQSQIKEQCHLTLEGNLKKGYNYRSLLYSKPSKDVLPLILEKCPTYVDPVHQAVYLKDSVLSKITNGNVELQQEVVDELPVSMKVVCTNPSIKEADEEIGTMSSIDVNCNIYDRIQGSDARVNDSSDVNHVPVNTLSINNESVDEAPEESPLIRKVVDIHPYSSESTTKKPEVTENGHRENLLICSPDNCAQKEVSEFKTKKETEEHHKFFDKNDAELNSSVSVNSNHHEKSIVTMPSAEPREPHIKFNSKTFCETTGYGAWTTVPTKKSNKKVAGATVAYENQSNLNTVTDYDSKFEESYSSHNRQSTSEKGRKKHRRNLQTYSSQSSCESVCSRSSYSQERFHRSHYEVYMNSVNDHMRTIKKYTSMFMYAKLMGQMNAHMSMQYKTQMSHLLSQCQRN